MKYTSYMLLALLALTPALAAEENQIQPGDWLYQIDLLQENIKELFTFDEEKKAEVLLEHLDERLEELKTVDPEYAIYAEKQLEKLTQKISILTERMETTGDLSGAGEGYAFGLAMREHAAERQLRAQEIHTELLDNPNMTEEQKLHLTQLFSRVHENMEEVRMRGENKQRKSGAAYRLHANISQEELPQRFMQAHQNAQQRQQHREARQQENKQRLENLINEETDETVREALQEHYDQRFAEIQ